MTIKLTKKVLLKKTPMFVDLFDSPHEVFKEFEVENYGHYDWSKGGEQTPPELLEKLSKRYTILYADYGYSDYSGSAYVLGYDNEKESFFEVHGSHCSCYGLEGQWSEEYCTIEELNEILNRRFEAKKDRYCPYDSPGDSRTFEAWLLN